MATAGALAQDLDREESQWYAFVGAFIGGVAGFLTYLFGLLTNLY